MQKNFGLGLYLALRDWLFERTMSICAVLALASMLAPILVLQGVRNGVILGMREKLLADPSVLIITPIGGGTTGTYSQEFIADLAKLDGATFAIGRIREIATDISVETERGVMTSIHMEPCSEHEPILEHNKIAVPNDGEVPEIVLAARAQDKLQVKVGERLKLKLGRKNHEGRFESLVVWVKLVGVLPSQVADRLVGFLPLKLLEDIEDFRDDLAAERVGFTGRPKEGQRTYASFRLYARDLDSVALLQQSLAKMGIETRTRAREIAAIKSLESALNRVILILSLAVGIGFLAFLLSSIKAALQRKERMLGLLRLFGFSRLTLISYPLMQTWLTALTGLLLSFAAYTLVGYLIDYIFSSQSSGLVLCRLNPEDLLWTVVVVFCLASLSALKSALQAASVDPSAVIREV